MRPGAEAANLKDALREYIASVNGEGKADPWEENNPGNRGTPGSMAAGRSDSNTGQAIPSRRRQHLPEDVQQAVAQAERLLGCSPALPPSPVTRRAAGRHQRWVAVAPRSGTC
jgi:hypothetical protein